MGISNKITFLLISLFCFALSAKNCKYEINKVDEFSGTVTKSTTATISKSWKIGFSRSDTLFSVGLYILLPGEINTAINKGDSLLVKLTDGSFLRFSASNTVTPRTDVLGTGAYASVVTDFSPVYQCTKDDLGKISNAGISVLRIFIGSQFMEVSVTEKNGKKIAGAAGCVLE